MKTSTILFLLYLVVFTICAIDPFDRGVWWVENIPVIFVVGVLVWLRPKFEFSDTAYLLMIVFIVLHTIGGYYTFERVPFDWITDFFSFDRNHYDRMAHFSVGFYAFAIAEFVWYKRLITHKITVWLFSVFAIMSVAAFYELLEWQFAVLSDPSQGIAVLGSQGDIWDAQKDILSDTLGAITALFLFKYPTIKSPA